MLPNLVEYHRPKTLNDALRLLGRDGIRTVVLAGGTQLLPSGDETVQAVVDLGALGLAGIEWNGKRAELGAMTTLQAIASDRHAKTFASGLLAEAATLCGPRNLRNMATVGGTVAACRPADDLLVALLALEAEISIDGERTRKVALDDLVGRGRETLRGSVLTRVTLPMEPAPGGGALVRVALTPSDAAIVNAAAVIAVDGLRCVHASAIVGGVGECAVRVRALQSALQGSTWDEACVEREAERFAATVEPPSDFRASGEYRRTIVAVVLERAVRQAWKRAQGAEQCKSA